MIDLIKQVEPFINPTSEDDFYYLQIIQRKKDNPQIGSTSRVIQNYFITSYEHLLSRYNEIKALCEQFNARASLRLNKRSFRKVAFKTQINIANAMSNNEYRFIKNSYSRACGQAHNDKDKKWIVDIDKQDTHLMSEITWHITEKCRPEGLKIYARLPTKSGIHLITKPFDLQEFKTKYPNIDIHKDNPINLYIPN